MRFPGFRGVDSFPTRDRHRGRNHSRRRKATHALTAERLEDRAMLAVAAAPPMITSVSDFASLALRNGSRTNAAPLTIKGTVVSGAAAVTVFNGNTALGSASIAGKTWTFTTEALAEGTYNFRARATFATTSSPASARPFVVTVDTTAPTAPTISNVGDDKAPVVGTVPRNGSTNDTTLSIYGTTEAGSTVEVFANGASLGRASVVGSTWRFTTKPLTSAGAVSFSATATDAAGNTSATTADPYSVNVDTGETKPTITGILDDVGSPTFSGDVLTKLHGLTNDTVLDIRGTADAGSSVRIFDGKTQIGAARAGNTGEWSFKTRPLTNGRTYRFGAQAADAAGNVSAFSDPVTPVLIDTTPPWVVIADVIAEGRSVGDRRATSSTALTLAGRSAPGSTVDVFDGGTPLGSVVAVGGEWSIAVTALPEGLHAFHAQATDAAGNMSVLPSLTYSVTVDRTAPGAPTMVSVVDSILPHLGEVRPGGATNDRSPLVSGTTELGTSVRVYAGTTQLGLAQVTGTTWTFRPSAPLADGTYELTATAIDPAGNESLPSAITTVVVDTTSDGFAGFGTLPADGTYELGDEILIEMEFDDVVFVEGEPRIALNTEPPRYATYVSGSGTDTLVFRYTPQLGDKSAGLDVAGVDALDLNGGTIRDAAGNDINGNLPAPGLAGSLSDLTNIVVDARLTFDPSAVQPPGAVWSNADDVIPTSTPLPPLTITFNAPLTSGLTARSFDLLLQNRSMSTEGVVIEDLGNNSYRLTLPPATHQSLPGKYRLDIGGLGSGIESGGVLMDTVVSLYWELS